VLSGQRFVQVRILGAQTGTRSGTGKVKVALTQVMMKFPEKLSWQHTTLMFQINLAWPHALHGLALHVDAIHK
jgi:hypothetical protein